MTWLLFQTRPNVERAVEEALSAPYRSVTSYFPKILKRIAHAGRVTDVIRPFLPRYGFADLQPLQSERVLKSCPGVICVLHAPEAEVEAAVLELAGRQISVIVDNKEVRLIDCPESYKPWNAVQFEHDELVRVIDGPFASFNALVDKYIAKGRRVQASVSIFGQMTPASFDPCQLERI